MSWRDWLTGLWLLVLYVASIIAVGVALTTYQLQHAIRTFDAGGQTLAVWEILQSRERWNEALELRIQAAEDLKEIEEEYGEEASRLAELSDIESDARKRRNDLLRGVVNQLRDAGVPEFRVQELEALADDDLSNRIAVVVGGMDRLKFTGSFQAALDRLNTARYELTLAYLDMRNARNAQLNIDKAKERLSEAAKNFEAVIVGLGADDRTRDAVGDFLSQLNYLSGLPYGNFFEFMTTTSDLLTLILVFAMGTLGGTIHLTRIYLGGQGKGGPGYYLFRPLLGAITALAVYVIFRSGAFLITEPTASGAKSPLSPFFISFVAIISGFLSEQALMSIETVGRRWFSSASSGRERWAIRVAEEAKIQNKSVADVQGLLDADTTRVTAWLEQHEPVPLTDQKVLSAWLGKPIRELFSDLPPSGQMA